MTAAQVQDQSSSNAWGIPRSKFFRWITVVILLAGAILRVARWIHPRSLWLDEIYLAHSVIGRSLHDLLFKPLDDWQAAPPGFLLLEHFCAAALGTSERSLRLVSLIFGLGSLPLMLAVSRRVLSDGGVALAMGFCSFLGPLIYFSNEVKPYACDVAASLGILLAMLEWWDRPRLHSALVAAGVGVAGIFLSFPAIFVLAGTAIWLLLRRRAARQVMWVGGIWLAAMAVDYFLFLRVSMRGEGRPHVIYFWQARNAFMPQDPWPAIQWIFSDLVEIARNPGAMWLDYPDAAIIGLIVGIAVMAQRGGKLLLVLAPLPVVLIASEEKLYPFADRLALFFVPMYLLIIAVGIESFWSNVGVNWAAKAAAAAIAGFIFLPSARHALGYLAEPPGREESLSAYRWAAQRMHKGDLIFLSRFAEPSFDYYQSEAGWPATMAHSAAVHFQGGPGLQPADAFSDVRTFAGRGRVWLIQIHPDDTESFDTEAITKIAFDQIGTVETSHFEPGVKVYLYNCAKR